MIIPIVEIFVATALVSIAFSVGYGACVLLNRINKKNDDQVNQ